MAFSDGATNPIEQKGGQTFGAVLTHPVALAGWLLREWAIRSAMVEVWAE
jgi:hypothetical protein